MGRAAIYSIENPAVSVFDGNNIPYSYTVTLAKPETRTGTVNVTKTVDDIVKTKTVTEAQEQSYTVMVPYTEERQGTRTVLRAAEGTDRVEVGFAAVTAWTIGGAPLTAAELTAEHIFVLPKGQSEYRYDPYFVAAMGRDVIVIAEPEGLGSLPFVETPPVTGTAQANSDESAQGRPENGPNAAPPVAAPAEEKPPEPASRLTGTLDSGLFPEPNSDNELNAVT